MIYGISGNPGAGKTSFVMSLLLAEHKKRERPIYTNINLKIPYDDYLFPFDVNLFHEFCAKELAFYNQYRDEQSKKRLEEFEEDSEIMSPDNYDEALRNSGILANYGNSIIFWDECQTDLELLDPVYVRWVTYHRHLQGMDVYLITPNLDLIHRKYKGSFSNVFYAVSASKRFLSSVFRIQEFSNWKMYKRDLIREISFTPTKEIFASYDSGHYKVDKSFFVKKLFPIIGLIVFVAIFYKYVVMGWLFHRHDEVDTDAIAASSPVRTYDDPNSVVNPSQPKPVDQLKKDALSDNGQLRPPPPLVNGNFQNYPNNSPENGGERHLIRFQCTQKYCYFPSSRFTISLASMDRFIKQFGGEVLAAESINKDLTTVIAVAPSELFNMLESYKITSGSDYYGTHSQTNSFGGKEMVPSVTGTPSSYVSPTSGV
jgi:hypothetical protein